MNLKKIFKSLDFTLLSIITVIFFCGLMMIYSATNSTLDNISRQFIVQLVSFVLGIFIILFMQIVKYDSLANLYKYIYVLSIMLLLLVYIPGLGVERGGARSWINLGFIDLQTSELAKIGYIIFLSSYLVKTENKLESIFDLIGPTMYSIPIFVLLLKQPDLGSTLVFVIIFLGILFVRGLKGRIIALGTMLVVILTPIIYRFMEPHQKQRIDAFLNPDDPNLPGNYHVIQSKITIGSGQLWGKGYLQGAYHRADYLPVQESDFIFAVLCEEMGFMGGAFLIFLYLLFLLRLTKVALSSKDEIGKLITVGILFMFLFQIFENIGMTLGVMPVTGITLPLFSYGGSSVVTTMISIGLIINIYIYRKKNMFN
jgi:rod shape determining protein RodA